jgi:hypothetical protein
VDVAEAGVRSRSWRPWTCQYQPRIDFYLSPRIMSGGSCPSTARSQRFSAVPNGQAGYTLDCVRRRALPSPIKDCSLDLEVPPSPRPGRLWTIRMTGHRDRTVSVTCSSSCSMPSRSRDVAALRRFAEAHASAHARAASVRPDAACACRQQQCTAHEETQVHCAGNVVLVLRHNPAVGQLWTLSEVCACCASLMTHARIVGHTAPRAASPPKDQRESAQAQSSVASSVVPGGFSAPLAPGSLGAPDTRLMRRDPGGNRQHRRGRGGDRRR